MKLKLSMVNLIALGACIQGIYFLRNFNLLDKEVDFESLCLIDDNLGHVDFLKSKLKIGFDIDDQGRITKCTRFDGEMTIKHTENGIDVFDRFGFLRESYNSITNKSILYHGGAETGDFNYIYGMCNVETFQYGEITIVKSTTYRGTTETYTVYYKNQYVSKINSISDVTYTPDIIELVGIDSVKYTPAKLKIGDAVITFDREKLEMVVDKPDMIVTRRFGEFINLIKLKIQTKSSLGNFTKQLETYDHTFDDQNKLLTIKTRVGNLIDLREFWNQGN